MQELEGMQAAVEELREQVGDPQSIPKCKRNSGHARLSKFKPRRLQLLDSGSVVSSK